MKRILVMAALIGVSVLAGCGGGGGGSSTAIPPPPDGVGDGDDPLPVQTQYAKLTMGDKVCTVLKAEAAPYKIDYASGTTVTVVRLFFLFDYGDGIGNLCIDTGNIGLYSGSNRFSLYPNGVGRDRGGPVVQPSLTITQQGDLTTGAHWKGTFTFYTYLGLNSPRVDVSCEFSVPSGPLSLQ